MGFGTEKKVFVFLGNIKRGHRMVRIEVMKLGALILIVGSSTSFQNCANKQFETISPEARLSKVSGETVFPTTEDGYGEIPGANGGGTGTGGIPVSGSGTGTGGIPVSGGTTPVNNGGSGTIPGSTSTPGSIFPSGSSSGVTSGQYGITTGSLPGMPAETFMATSDPNITSTSSTSGRGPASVPSTTGMIGGGVTTGTPITNMPTPFEGRVMPLAFDCSDFRSDANSNLAMARSLVIELTDNKGTPVCAFEDASLRTTLIQTKQFDAGLLDVKCPSLKAGKYALRMRDPGKSIPTGKLGGNDASDYLTDPRTTNLVYNSENPLGLVIEKKANGSWSRSDRYMIVITDRNPYTDEGDKLVNMAMLTSRAQCDAHQSPLVIHLTSEVGQKANLVLSPQTSGVMFDILGQNSYPTAHTPKKISWHKNLSYVFIVLPDANGQVKGINQLFGNNTMGPDGRFALNGYEALGKYDGKSSDGKATVGVADGYINRFDPIFSKLRIWRDENSDGTAQPGELYTMDQAGLMVIDLHYDPSFYERDRYGNETKYKSVVQTRDGKLHLMFDLWYAYLER